MSDHPTSFDQVARQIALAAVEELLPRLKEAGLPIAPQWLSPKDAAIYSGIPLKSLESMRRSGGGPSFSKAGHLIRYNVGELDSWLRSLEVKP